MDDLKIRMNKESNVKYVELNADNAKQLILD